MTYSNSSNTGWDSYISNATSISADRLNRIEEALVNSGIYVDSNTITGTESGVKQRDQLIEALFRLKPTLRDEYGKDFDRFAKEITAAGAVAFGEESLAFIKALL